MPHNQGTGNIVVGPGGVRRLDPRQLEQQASGMRAQDRLTAQNQGPAMANALRMSQAQLGGVEGQGASTTGPSGWNALATILQQRKGQSQLSGMKEKADALRGEVETGRGAQLQRGEDVAARDFDYRSAFDREKLDLERMRIEAMKGKGAGAGARGIKMAVSDRKKYTDIREEYDSSMDLLTSFKPEYQGLSGVNTIDEFMNATANEFPGFTSDKTKEKAAWWKDHKARYDLVIRHGLFGSQLTTMEASEWKKAAINMGMTGAEIKKRLTKQAAIVKNKGSKAREEANILFPEQSRYIDSVLPTSMFGAGEAAPAAPAAGGDEFADMSLEDLEAMATAAESEAATATQATEKKTALNKTRKRAALASKAKSSGYLTGNY